MLRYCDFRIDGGSLQQLPDGSIKVTGQLSRPGIFSYRNDNGTERREYRPGDEVFRKAALETFAAAPITVNHPRTASGQRLVNSDSWRQVAIGHLGENVREDNGHVVADMYIRDSAAVTRIKNGDLRHISCGYNVDYDPTPGVTPEGQRYDGVQRNIRGNHVALLPNGIAPRGGDQCVLRLDSAGDEIVPLNLPQMDLETLQAQLTAVKAELATARADAADVKTLKSQLETANAKIAALEAELAPARMDARVADHAAAVELAKSLGVDPASKTALQIKRACVAKKTPELATRADSMSADALDAVIAVYGAQPHASLAAAAAVTNPGADGTRTDAAAPAGKIPTYSELYNKHVKEQANAWKGGSN